MTLCWLIVHTWSKWENVLIETGRHIEYGRANAATGVWDHSMRVVPDFVDGQHRTCHVCGLTQRRVIGVP